MKTSIAATLVALSLAGCSSSVLQSKEDPIITELQGKSSNYVQSKLGLPNRRSETRSGAEVWIYLDKQKGITAKQCEVTLSIRDSRVESVLISTESASLLSVVSSSCKNIRNSVTGQG